MKSQTLLLSLLQIITNECDEGLFLFIFILVILSDFQNK